MTRYSASIPVLSLLQQDAEVSETLERKYFSSVFHLDGNYDFSNNHNQDNCTEIQNLLSSSRQSETRKSFSRSSTVDTCETILRLLFNISKIFDLKYTNDSVPCEAVEPKSDDKEDSNEPLEVESPEDQLSEPPPNINKSMRSMSRSTFDSIIDEFIEDDWEKRSAFGVSLAVVLIWTIFLTLLGVALSVSLGVQHASQSKKLAFTLCSKVRQVDYCQAQVQVQVPGQVQVRSQFRSIRSED